MQVSVDAGDKAVKYGAPKLKWQPVLCLQDQGEGQNRGCGIRLREAYTFLLLFCWVNTLDITHMAVCLYACIKSFTLPISSPSFRLSRKWGQNTSGNTQVWEDLVWGAGRKPRLGGAGRDDSHCQRTCSEEDFCTWEKPKCAEGSQVWNGTRGGTGLAGGVEPAHGLVGNLHREESW